MSTRHPISDLPEYLSVEGRPIEVHVFGNGPRTILLMAGVCGLPVKDDIGYPCPGSMGTYFGWERQLPVITLELAKPEDSDLDIIKRAVLREIGLERKAPGFITTEARRTQRGRKRDSSVWLGYRMSRYRFASC